MPVHGEVNRFFFGQSKANASGSHGFVAEAPGERRSPGRGLISICRPLKRWMHLQKEQNRQNFKLSRTPPMYAVLAMAPASGLMTWKSGVKFIQGLIWKL